MSLAEQLSNKPMAKHRRLEVVGQPVATQSDFSIRLRNRLILTDLTALLLAWLPVRFLPSQSTRLVEDLLIPVGASLVGLFIMGTQELFLSRVSAIRALELARLVRVSLLLVLAGLATRAIPDILNRAGTLRISYVLIGSTLSLVALVIARSVFRAWLASARTGGRYLRDIMIIGSNEGAAELTNLITDHPESGYRVVGVVGDRDDAVMNGLGSLWASPLDEVLLALSGHSVTGVIIATGSLNADDLQECIKVLQARRVHVQLASGLRNTDYRRLRATPIAYEPVFYLEPTILSGWQVVAKRLGDILFATVALVASAPAFVAIALIIKLEDRGPIFFRQTRVGRDGRHFNVLKFRTMCVDAEARLAALRAANERSGPLFKMDRDPRITRIGRLLRESSLDELPQFLNVLRGEMSVVGPRPALPSEVAEFDPELLNRTKVHPGITGLWQVEARDNPSFGAYRRLDLFYVENWTPSLDFVIILATVEQVVSKLILSVLRRKPTMK